MKNKKPILILAAVIILCMLVFAVWHLTNKKTDQNSTASKEQDPQSIQKPEAEDTTSSVNGTIYDLFKLGKTLKCEYSIDEGETKLAAVSYISGKNMRGDFENTDPTGNQLQSHMISDGEWVYTWTSAVKQGVKMKLSSVEAQTPAPDATTQNHDVFKDTANYTCSPWVEDTSLFQIPSDVTFTDFSENNGSMCAACDYAQDEAEKAGCKKQLGCQ